LGKIVISPGEIVHERLMAACAIKRLLQWYADAAIINPDIVWQAVDA